ncbi:MAG TPA: hypothetical protein VH391_09265 [Solirubrobacterales bacterium]|jgi:hypothetical protein
MPDEERADTEPQDSGVFGKLPSARPGVRSPRRGKEGKKGRSAPTPKTSESARPPTQPGSTAGPAREARATSEPEAPEADEGAGVEDLAWAGITVAAEAATLGVRLLSRALEAVRGPSDRR